MFSVPASGDEGVVSLRGHPVQQRASLPDGRVVDIEVRVVADPYLEGRTDTVGVELRTDGEVLASLNTVLDPDEESGARSLAREIAAGLESGELEPTAGSIEPLADQPR
jgi:hypothetical protein